MDELLERANERASEWEGGRVNRAQIRWSACFVRPKSASLGQIKNNTTNFEFPFFSLDYFVCASSLEKTL